MMRVLLSLIGIVLICSTTKVHAAESSSYRLYDEFPNYADRNAAESSTYKMNENGETWTSLPLVGSNFQIVTAPPTAEEAAAGTTGGGGGQDVGDTPDSGGRRGDGPPVGPEPTPEPDKPSAPEEPTEPTEPTPPTPPPTEPQEPSVPSVPSVPSTPSQLEPFFDIKLTPVPYEYQISDIHYFQYTERACPVLKAAAPQKELFAAVLPYWFIWILILLQLLILLTITGIYYEYRKQKKES